MASSVAKGESGAAPGLSFAKVAASVQKESVTLSYAKMAATNIQMTKPAAEKSKSEKSKPAENSEKKAASPEKTENKNPAEVNVQTESALDDSLANSVRKLSISPCLIVNGSSPVKDTSMSGYANSSPEDVYQRNDSGSDLGTKPPSLDGKSITSGTTFALDEKESLRPDDSASVKAAEDDDTFSGRGSIVAGSRIGSEAAARAYHSQIYEAAQRRAMLPPLESQPQGVLTPQSGSSGPLVAGNLPQQSFKGNLPTKDDFHNIFYKTSPDDKLMEAMEDQRNRIFLLRLEQDVINFVRDTKEPYFDVPPSNSFCRMLTHKLADYYHLTHQYDGHANQGSVRIFRTPFCRLPETLSSISTPPTAENTPPPVPAMKILRRGGPASTNPSKPSSEDGGDGKEKKKDMKGLTLEEKQAHYEATRLRIFGKDDGKSGEVTPDTEEGQDMSRSSSVSGKNKAIKPKRRPRNDSDTFDSRSSYWQFSPMQFAPGGPAMNQFGPMMYNQNVYTPPMSTYMPQMPQMAQGAQQPGYQQGQPQQYQESFTSYPNQQQVPQNFQPSPQPGAAWAAQQQQPPFQPSPRMGPPQQPQPQGQNSPYAQAQRTPVQNSSIPYAYGQLPASGNPADPKSQHPIPGSFNRHAFNPKTQSFVPGGMGGGSPMLNPRSTPGSNHSSPKPMGGARYGSYQGSPMFGGQMQMGGQMMGAGGMGMQGQMGGFGIQMSRQSSNNSVGVPGYGASPHLMARPMNMQQMPMQMQPMQPMQGQQGPGQAQGGGQPAIMIPTHNGQMIPMQQVGGMVMMGMPPQQGQPQMMQGQAQAQQMMQMQMQSQNGQMQGQMQMGVGMMPGYQMQAPGPMGYYPQGPKGPGQN